MEEAAAAAWRGLGGGFQPATNYWSVQEPAAAPVWAPAGGGLPAAVEYASVIDIFDTSYSLQAYVPPECSQEEVVEYFCDYSAAASQHHPPGPGDKALQQNGETSNFSNHSDANAGFKRVAQEVEGDADQMKMKMHRYPPSLAALDKCYTQPRVVALGPYHRGKQGLQKAEKWKHMAAYHLVKRSKDRLLHEVFGAVAAAADKARSLRLYDEDAMAEAGIRCQDDFRHMMFFDACFLVECVRMLVYRDQGTDKSLYRVLRPFETDLSHDLQLLENQIPWQVVEAVTNNFTFREAPFESYIKSRRAFLQDHKDSEQLEETPFTWDETYEPPHLLGLIRHHLIGTSRICDEEIKYGRNWKEILQKKRDEQTQTGSPKVEPKKKPESRKAKPKKKPRSFSVSAVELSEIGITVAPNKTPELIHMDLRREGARLFPQLLLTPLSLDQTRASRLVSMAAFEICSMESFGRCPADSAVSSYLLLLAMLVHREEDVRELRARGLLQGGGGLTDQEALSFFSSIQNLRIGLHYNYIMREIESYKDRRWTSTGLHAFFYNNMKTIAAVGSGIVGVGGIIGTLLSIKGAL